MKKSVAYVFFLSSVILLSLFVGSHYYHYSPLYAPIIKATAVIHPTAGNITHGIVNFIKEKNGIRIKAEINGLTPGKHGFHIHEFGDCACADGTCTGSHYNPTNQPHGGPHSPQQHVGDFGNVVANEEGNAIYNELNTHISLNGPHSIIGRGIIIHADEDDLVSQPTGNAGARIGCGVIGIDE